MDFLNDSILSPFGRPDFIGGIDNEALDFGQLDSFIHMSNNGPGATAGPNVTTMPPSLTSSSSSQGHSMGSNTQPHLPESPPDSGSEPPYSPADIHALSISSNTGVNCGIIINVASRTSSVPTNNDNNNNHNNNNTSNTSPATQSQQRMLQQPLQKKHQQQQHQQQSPHSHQSQSQQGSQQPQSELQNELTPLTNLSQASMELDSVEDIHHIQSNGLSLYTTRSNSGNQQHHAQPTTLSNGLLNKNGNLNSLQISQQPQQNKLLMQQTAGAVTLLDLGAHNYNQSTKTYTNLLVSHTSLTTVPVPTSIPLPESPTPPIITLAPPPPPSPPLLSPPHTQQPQQQCIIAVHQQESHHQHQPPFNILTVVGGGTRIVNTADNNNGDIAANVDGTGDSTCSANSGILRSNEMNKSHQCLTRLIASDVLYSQQIQHVNNICALPSNGNENVGSTCGGGVGVLVGANSVSSSDTTSTSLSLIRKRKLEQSADIFAASKIKPEPVAVSPICGGSFTSIEPASPNASIGSTSSVCNSSIGNAGADSANFGSTISITGSSSLDNAQTNATGIMQQISDSNESCSLQCIRFSPFQDKKWHILCDQGLQELHLPHYRVEADKGFNFSNSDDAFVCQKKNHFQITCHAQLQGSAVFVRTEGGLEKIKSFHLHFYGVKLDAPTQTIRVEQSQSDRSKKPFHPVPIELQNQQISKVTVGRLHFSETTSNNMRKKGRPNPEQRYFQLVVGLHAHTHSGHFPIVSHGSERIIVRASNPGQFESDVELCWQRGVTQESIYHSGRVGVNTDRPDESLVVHGNIKISGHIVQPSDSRAKQEICELDTSQQLKNLQKIRVVRYRYDPDFALHSGLTTLINKEEIIDTGVIAQEIQQVLPDAVQESGSVLLPNGQAIDNFLVVNKDRIFLENIGAVKELCKVTDSLETRIEQLELINSRLVRIQKIDSYKECMHLNCSAKGCEEFEEPCLNKLIQIIIVTLVIIMAVCLTAISTLYFIEHHKQSERFFSRYKLNQLNGANSHNSFDYQQQLQHIQLQQSQHHQSQQLQPQQQQQQQLQLMKQQKLLEFQQHQQQQQQQNRNKNQRIDTTFPMRTTLSKFTKHLVIFDGGGGVPVSDSIDGVGGGGGNGRATTETSVIDPGVSPFGLIENNFSDLNDAEERTYDHDAKNLEHDKLGTSEPTEAEIGYNWNHPIIPIENDASPENNQSNNSADGTGNSSTSSSTNSSDNHSTGSSGTASGSSSSNSSGRSSSRSSGDNNELLLPDVDTNLIDTGQINGKFNESVKLHPEVLVKNSARIKDSITIEVDLQNLAIGDSEDQLTTLYDSKYHKEITLDHPIGTPLGCLLTVQQENVETCQSACTKYMISERLISEADTDHLGSKENVTHDKQVKGVNSLNAQNINTFSNNDLNPRNSTHYNNLANISQVSDGIDNNNGMKINITCNFNDNIPNKSNSHDLMKSEQLDGFTAHNTSSNSNISERYVDVNEMLNNDPDATSIDLPIDSNGSRSYDEFNGFISFVDINDSSNKSNATSVNSTNNTNHQNNYKEIKNECNNRKTIVDQEHQKNWQIDQSTEHTQYQISTSSSSSPCYIIEVVIRTSNFNKSLGSHETCYGDKHNLNITYNIPISKYIKDDRFEVVFQTPIQLHWRLCTTRERYAKNNLTPTANFTIEDTIVHQKILSKSIFEIVFPNFGHFTKQMEFRSTYDSQQNPCKLTAQNKIKFTLYHINIFRDCN